MQVHPVVQTEITSKMEDILENVILGPIGSKVTHTHTHTHTFLKENYIYDLERDRKDCPI